ncbi:hypothetical protein FACS189432_08790 [Bacteroidia bacterium]|nr:hypothetical protein FACS189432_08790 [Bacteroidia bacterium]
MRKIVLIITGFIAALSCYAQQDNYSVKATLGSAKDNTKVLLTYRIDGKTLVDSTTVKNQKFEFKGSLIDPFRATLEIVGAEDSKQPDRSALNWKW